MIAGALVLAGAGVAWAGARSEAASAEPARGKLPENRDTRRDFGLDLFRASAILLVLFYHSLHSTPETPAWAAELFRFGWIGVDLFFVLSGFLIGSQAFAEPKGQPISRMLLKFWTKRWTRTLPLYFVVLFFYAVLKPRLFGVPFYGGFDWRFLVFLQNSTGRIADFGQSWSICIEEQFYLVFPLLVFVVGVRGKWIWLVPLVLSVAIRYWKWRELGLPMSVAPSLETDFANEHFRFPTLQHLDGISLGVFLATTRDLWMSWSAPARAGLGILGAAGLVLSCAWLGAEMGGVGTVFYFTALALCFSAILIGVQGARRWPGLAGVAIERVALWSYGAYLWNNAFMRLIERQAPPWPWFLTTAAFMAASLALAWLSYITIEKWGLRLRDVINRRVNI